VLFRKFLLPWLRFCEVLLSIFWFVRFDWDCELLVIVGLFRVLGWFEIVFRLSGLLRGFINNGFLFELSLIGFPFKEDLTEDLSSSLCLIMVSYFLIFAGLFSFFLFLV
jgi:hypothetical protein